MFGPFPIAVNGQDPVGLGAGLWRLDRQQLQFELDGRLCLADCLATGKGIDAIAEMLMRSARTTSTHKMHLTQKFGIENDAELICYAIKHGLIYERDRS
ncbi:response regulator transcription factor [Caballeronia sp. LjRoot31]|uniref:response regulator transcription factor n=1 Tax=Caballeronia sp. LjRoot31 TaxID=3342324 RepID=UPI003ECD7605